MCPEAPPKTLFFCPRHPESDLDFRLALPIFDLVWKTMAPRKRRKSLQEIVQVGLGVFARLHELNEVRLAALKFCVRQSSTK
jgi:hypothetical protein